MEINTIGIIIARTKFGETSAIYTLFTKDHGVFKGLLKGALSKKNQGDLQIGNIVNVVWRSRLEESLGFLKLELEQSYLSSIWNNSQSLYALNTICELLLSFLPEKHSYIDLYESTTSLLELLNCKDFFVFYLKWELLFLRAIGYGPDLAKCVLCNQEHKISYISPKTGFGACKDQAHKYHNKLIIVPDYLVNVTNMREAYNESISEYGIEDSNKNSDYRMSDVTFRTTLSDNKISELATFEISLEQKQQGLNLVEYFFNKANYYYHKQLPLSRSKLMASFLS